MYSLSNISSAYGKIFIVGDRVEIDLEHEGVYAYPGTVLNARREECDVMLLSGVTRRCIPKAQIRGYLDKIEVSDVGAFEDAWRKHVQSNHAGILEELTKEKAISDALETKLGSVCGTMQHCWNHPYQH